MNRFLLCGALGAAASLSITAPAQAHATLAVTEAQPNSSYRGTIRIGHGCDGSPTTEIRLTVPEGVIDAKPMPKPGWTLTVTRGAYARSYDLYGKPTGEGAREIVWSGSALPDEFYDEFVFTGRITDAFRPGERVSFPIVQTCREGIRRWTEIAAPGQDPHSLKGPAPTVLIRAAVSPTASVQPASAVKAGALTVEQPWIRATPGGAKVAGGYLRVVNAGPEPDRLLASSIPVAARGEVHEMSVENGVMKMRELGQGLVIPAGGAVELKPGGYHLMFMDLTSGLSEGMSVPGTLTFEKAGRVAVTFQVGGIGARSGPSEGSHHH